MADVEDLLSDLADFADVPVLLVACGFDGALAPPDDDRTLQQSSEALNTLHARAGTTIAVISRRPAEEMAELMFLSGSKGGLRMIAPDEVAVLRKELGATALVVDTDPASLADLGPDDLGILVQDPDEAASTATATDAATDLDVWTLADCDAVAELLEELVAVRR